MAEMDHGQMQRTESGTGQIKIASGSNLVLGLWLIIAPFLLAYSGIAAAMWNDILLGVTIAALAWIRVANPSERAWLSWTNVALGLWVVAAPFVLAYSGTAAAMWNDIVVGLLVASLGTWSAVVT